MFGKWMLYGYFNINDDLNRREVMQSADPSSCRNVLTYTLESTATPMS